MGILFSDRLTSIRKKREYTQQRVADYLGITRPAYTAYERGTRQPDFNTLIRLADFFEVSTDYLLGKSNDENKLSINSRLSLSKEEMKIFEELKKHPILFHDLTSDPEKKIKELIKLQKAKKLLLDDDEEMGEEFGDLED